MNMICFCCKLLNELLCCLIDGGGDTHTQKERELIRKRQKEKRCEDGIAHALHIHILYNICNVQKEKRMVGLSSSSVRWAYVRPCKQKAQKRKVDMGWLAQILLS